jgi:hypothetical protein
MVAVGGTGCTRQRFALRCDPGQAGIQAVGVARRDASERFELGRPPRQPGWGPCTCIDIWEVRMAVLAAAFMLVITVSGVFGRLVYTGGRGTGRAARQPPVVSVMPVVFSLVMIGSVVGAGLTKTTSPPAPTSVGQTPSVYQSGLGGDPVYPGPSNDAPLPRLNLPTIYNYGSGPRHPVPDPSSSVRPLLGVNRVPEHSSARSGTELPAPAVPPVPPPACPSSSTLPPTPPGPIAIGPCLGSPVPPPP